jgi:hypothetical protein
LAFNFPSRDFEKPQRYAAKGGVDDGGVKNGAVHGAVRSSEIGEGDTLARMARGAPIMSFKLT